MASNHPFYGGSSGSAGTASEILSRRPSQRLLTPRSRSFIHNIPMQQNTPCSGGSSDSAATSIEVSPRPSQRLFTPRSRSFIHDIPMQQNTPCSGGSSGSAGAASEILSRRPSQRLLTPRSRSFIHNIPMQQNTPCSGGSSGSAATPIVVLRRPSQRLLTPRSRSSIHDIPTQQNTPCSGASSDSGGAAAATFSGLVDLLEGGSSGSAATPIEVSRRPSQHLFTSRSRSSIHDIPTQQNTLFSGGSTGLADAVEALVSSLGNLFEGISSDLAATADHGIRSSGSKSRAIVFVDTSQSSTPKPVRVPLAGGSSGSGGTSAAPVSSLPYRSTPRAQAPMRSTRNRSFNLVKGAMAPATGELRIVLVGKTGSGKSASGNTILGWDAFESVMSAKSITDECSKARATVDGQEVVIVDTPGLFDTRHGMNTTCRHISQCISYACPGPHVFLIVIGLGRYTEEEMQTVQQIQELFGQAADRYSMVLFTRGDDLKGTTIEQFIEGSQELQELVTRCHDQYHVFNNNLKTGRQVTELLQKIRNMVRNNGGSHYTSEMFQEAERAIEEEKQRILKEKEEEMRIEREKLRKELRAEYEEQLRSLEEHYEAERMEDRRVREQENQAMQARLNKLTKEGKRFIKAKVEMEMERHREKQNMELVLARERQDREQIQVQMQDMVLALNMQNNQNMMAMQNQQQQHQREMERQRMELQQRDEVARKDREINRARWEAEKAELKARHERELRAKEQALKERREREARDEAEKRNPVVRFFDNVADKAGGAIKSVGRFFGSIFG